MACQGCEREREREATHDGSGGCDAAYLCDVARCIGRVRIGAVMQRASSRRTSYTRGLCYSENICGWHLRLVRNNVILLRFFLNN